MIRTQAQLTEGQLNALKRMAAQEGVSVAELIRRGVDLIIQNHGLPARQDRLERARQLPGKFRSGLGDLASEHDRYLADGDGE